MNRANKNIFQNLLIFDAHCDTANVLLDDSIYFIEEKNSHLDNNKIVKGGLKAQIFAIWVNALYPPGKSEKKALLLYDTLEEKIFKPGFGIKVEKISEMDSAINNNKLACWIFLEGGHIIENSIEKLEFFYKLGVRGMTLVHTKNTDWADSSGDDPKWDGLNKLGSKIIKVMNEKNMAIDVSHSSDKTVEDVLESSSKPIMASHSCARALCNIPRNIPDNLIKEIAENKGFIGVNFFPGFLEKKIYDQLMKNLEKHKNWYIEKLAEYKNNPDMLDKIEIGLYTKMVKENDKINLKSVIDHIKHIANIGGIDCVGLGSDFDGIPSTPKDLTDVSCYPNLEISLSDNGFNNKEIEKIMGMNLYNFLKKTVG
jgi:membrane dipeptidase